MFQVLYYTLKRLGNTENIVSWKSKSLSTKKRATPTTIDNIHQLTGMEIQVFVYHLKEAV